MSHPGVPTTFSPEHTACIVTAGGWSRSGKGTTMSYLQRELERADQNVVLIDQGVKFRAMAEVALCAGQVLDSPASLNDFISSPEAKKATLAVLDEVALMDEAAIKERLYKPELSKASGKVGKVSSAHAVAVGLLRSQVEGAVESEADIILIDGRSMEKYARQFTEQGLAEFVMGWYFKCDPVIAARRSLGLCDEFEALSTEDRMRLLSETLNISDRNRSDTLRHVDPLREPMTAYHLDLLTYDLPNSDPPLKRSYDILHRGGLTVVDTSYTESIAEMTAPITELTKFGLLLKGPLQYKHLGLEAAPATHLTDKLL